MRNSVSRDNMKKLRSLNGVDFITFIDPNHSQTSINISLRVSKARFFVDLEHTLLNPPRGNLQTQSCTKSDIGFLSFSFGSCISNVLRRYFNGKGDKLKKLQGPKSDEERLAMVDAPTMHKLLHYLTSLLSLAI